MTTTELEAMYESAKSDFLSTCYDGTHVEISYWLGRKHAIYAVLNPRMMSDLNNDIARKSKGDSEDRAYVRGARVGLKEAGYTS